jgi:hypothetical protein
VLVVRVELHSAITGKVTEIARMFIANTGTGTPNRGNYCGRALRKGAKDTRLIRNSIRLGEVYNYARKSKHVWNLVAKMLTAMEYK